MLVAALTPLAPAVYSSSSAGATSNGIISVVAAENEYGNVTSQIGGRYVHVVSVASNPNTDPHSYEVSPSVAGQISEADLVVQNGLGYDSFMNKIESAAPNARRRLVDVQQVLRLPDSTPNPHVWYRPSTMAAVARAIGDRLADIDRPHASYFRARVARFDTSLRPWFQAIAEFNARYAGTPAATTEPVADYLLEAMGIKNLTPFAFQSDVMNGTDPPPQDIALENRLLSAHTVRVFVYNQQVVDSLTDSIRANARKAGVPVVGAYETMPTAGYDYQSWMLAETKAIQAAVAHGRSAVRS